MRTKRFLRTLVVGLFMCVCLLFSACAKVEGTYKFKSMTYEEGGMTVELVAGEKFMNSITLSEDFMVITLGESGVVTVVSSASAGEISQGTWTTKQDKQIELTVNGETILCECDGKTLSLDIEGVKMILEKK